MSVPWARNTRQLCVAVLASALLTAGAARAEIQTADLRVNGLTCPFCAFGIEKKLLSVHGVREVEVFLDDGRIALTFQPDSEATVQDLEEAVQKGGFDLAGLSLRVSGELLEKDGVRLVAHPGMTLRLLEERGGSAGPVSAEMLQRLREREALDRGSLVVEGTVKEWDEATPALLLDRIE